MKTYLQQISRFEILAFITGFVLMSFELVAARLLAPTVGSSSYVWTSVIGVIIAALSIGYAVGGKLADRRVKVLDVAWILLFAAVCVLITAVLSPNYLEFLARSFSDTRVRGVLASVVLFAPLSFLLGVTSPYLVRLRVSSAKTSGESVALLSALNSVGGITGTFLTGFVFFGYVATTHILIIIAAGLLMASWMLSSREQVRRRMAVTGLAGVLSCVALFTSAREGLLATIDTPSATYQILQGTREKEPVRVLMSGPTGYQSGVYAYKSSELVFFYAKEIAEIAAQAPNKQRILVLGGGAFTLPRYLAEQYPQSQIDVVEIDPQLPDIAQEYFYYTAPRNVRVTADDARAFLNRNATTYDIIIVDVYADSSVPFALTTKEYAQQVKRALSKNGVVIVNYVAGYSNACAPLFKGLHAAYHAVLPVYAFYPNYDLSLQRRQNVVAAYAQDLRWLSRKGASSIQIAPANPFTDGFAPVERLERVCQKNG
jgi:predicted membrane-bound spermidine synthase